MTKGWKVKTKTMAIIIGYSLDNFLLNVKHLCYEMTIKTDGLQGGYTVLMPLLPVNIVHRLRPLIESTNNTKHTQTPIVIGDEKMSQNKTTGRCSVLLYSCC